MKAEDNVLGLVVCGRPLTVLVAAPCTHTEENDAGGSGRRRLFHT